MPPKSTSAASAASAAGVSNKRSKPSTPKKEKPAEKRAALGADSLNGKPEDAPTPPPVWKTALMPENLARLKIGSGENWGQYLVNHFLELPGAKKAKFTCPPGLVIKSFLDGVGRAPMDKPSGRENNVQIVLKFGKLPESIMKKNPALLFEHREFMHDMKVFIEEIWKRMFVSDEFAKEKKDAEIAGETNKQMRFREGWPEKQSCLKGEKIVELLMAAKDITEEVAEAMLEKSGLKAVDGFSEKKHDEEMRKEVHEIIEAEDKSVFNEVVMMDAFQNWTKGTNSPVEFDENEGTMLLKFSRGAMFDKKEADKKKDIKEGLVPLTSTEAALQHYYDLVGPCAPYKKINVEFKRPAGEGRGVEKLFEAEFEKDPLFQAVFPGDLVAMEYGFRMTDPTNKKTGAVGIKGDPKWHNIFLHHQGDKEENKLMLPDTAAAGADYGIAPKEYKAYR